MAFGAFCAIRTSHGIPSLRAEHASIDHCSYIYIYTYVYIYIYTSVCVSLDGPIKAR